MLLLASNVNSYNDIHLEYFYGHYRAQEGLSLLHERGPQKPA